jgi:hypothetical protein
MGAVSTGQIKSKLTGLTVEPVILLTFTGKGFGNRVYPDFPSIQYFPLDPTLWAGLISNMRHNQVIFPFTRNQYVSINLPDIFSASDFRQWIQGEFTREQFAVTVIVQTAFNQFSKHLINQKKGTRTIYSPNVINR